MGTTRLAGNPFAITSRLNPEGHGFHSVAEFVCTRCDDEKIGFKVKRNELNPEKLLKQAAAHGWAVKLGREGAICPTCQAARKETARGESPLATSSNSERPEKVVTLKAVPPTSPTTEQRLRIRGFLDRNFDDGKGYYLDGYSDQRIADEMNIPRIWVENIREAAYGPLKEPPEIKAAQQASDALLAAIEQAGAAKAGFQAAIEAAQAEVASLDKMLSNAHVALANVQRITGLRRAG